MRQAVPVNRPRPTLVAYREIAKRQQFEPADPGPEELSFMPERPSERLKMLKITLPEAPAPVAAYQPVVQEGALAWVSGQIPLQNGELMVTGSVPEQVPVEDATAAARQCAINALAALQAFLGSIDRVVSVVRVGVFVACGESFSQHSVIANGASELFEQVFGESGKHARAATGASSLPLRASVEVEVLVSVSESE